MAEHVEVVINIPKYYLTHPQDYTCLAECVRRGTILPEHHGDLIDVNVLKNNIHYVPLAPIFLGDYVTYRNVIFADILDMLPTIIEGSESE